MAGLTSWTVGSTGWTRRGLRWTTSVVILASLNACGTSTGADRSLNPFCSIVGPPPAEMIPAEGEPHGWIDDYLAVYDASCT